MIEALLGGPTNGAGLNFKTLRFTYWGGSHVPVSILLLYLRLLSSLSQFQSIFVSNVAISSFLCRCFKAMLLVGIYSDRASWLGFIVFHHTSEVTILIDLFHSTANHLQLPRLFQLRPACLLFPRQILLHPHWPRPFLKGTALCLSPWQPIQGHRIAHQGHRPWQATVAHRIGPCLLTLFPPLQLQMHPQICRRMVLWTQTNLTRTTDFYINRTSQNFRKCTCVLWLWVLWQYRL